jgi:DNA-binding transcriptional LysR family regulator
VDLLEGEFDVGVRIGRLGDSSLIARRIARVRLVVCAAPEYLARHGVPQMPEDLASHNCLEYTYFESRGEWRLRDPTDAEIVVPVSGRYLANNADVLRSTALAGGGIILVRTRRVGISRQRYGPLLIFSSFASAASLHGTAPDLYDAQTVRYGGVP